MSTRAARLAASGIVALVKKINKIDGCSVAVDGSLYKLHPKFPKRYKTLKFFTQGSYFEATVIPLNFL